MAKGETRMAETGHEKTGKEAEQVGQDRCHAKTDEEGEGDTRMYEHGRSADNGITTHFGKFARHIAASVLGCEQFRRQ